MSTKHYDIALIGGSLAARIAAALLARRGSKVLFLRQREAMAPAWFHSSLFLEKLLGTLGGRSCFMEQRPIQVLSRQARITLSHDIPLAAELARELGATAPPVTAWLERLRSQGEQLEFFFCENGGLRWPSLRAGLRFKLLGIRHKINWRELDAPLCHAMAQLPQAAVPLVTDLLQGLSLRNIGQLTIARAALLWAQTMRPENLREPDFSQLLSKRFDQFHGLKAPLEELDSISFDGRRWTGGRFRNGGLFSADCFLLGDVRWADRFGADQPGGLPPPPLVVRRNTSSLTGQLSPLLASRVICGGDLPMRLAIEEQEGQLQGQLLIGGEAAEAALRRQLEPALPFARYQLTEEAPTSFAQAAPEYDPHPRGLASLPLRIGRNLYCADNNCLLAEMGAAGAALLGWTLAEQLAAPGKPGEA